MYCSSVVSVSVPVTLMTAVVVCYAGMLCSVCAVWYTFKEFNIQFPLSISSAALKLKKGNPKSSAGYPCCRSYFYSSSTFHMPSSPLLFKPVIGNLKTCPRSTQLLIPARNITLTTALLLTTTTYYTHYHQFLKNNSNQKL